MPYIEGTKQKNQDEFGNPVTNTGQGNILSQGTSTNTQQTSNVNTPSKSGSWTNLNQYIDANKNNNQTANQFGQNAKNLYDDAKNAGSQINQNITNYGTNLKDYIARQGKLKSAIDNPEQATKEEYQNNLSGYAKPENYLESNQYQTDYSNALDTKNKNYDKLNLLSTQGGQGEFLSGLNKEGSNYSQGSKALDRFLLNNTDEGINQLKNIESYKSDLPNYNLVNDFSEINNLQSGINKDLLSSDDVSNYYNTALQNEYKNAKVGENSKGYDAEQIDPQAANIAKIKSLESLTGINNDYSYLLGNQPKNSSVRNYKDLNINSTVEQDAATQAAIDKAASDKKAKEDAALQALGYLYNQNSLNKNTPWYK